MESVKLPSVNYFWQIQDGDIQDGVPLLSKHHFVPVVTFDQPYIFEGDRDNSRSTTLQSLQNHGPGGRWLPHVCELAKY